LIGLIAVVVAFVLLTMVLGFLLTNPIGWLCIALIVGAIVISEVLADE